MVRMGNKYIYNFNEHYNGQKRKMGLRALAASDETTRGFFEEATRKLRLKFEKTPTVQSGRRTFQVKRTACTKVLM